MNNRRGFTLVELLVVMGVIGLMLSLTLPAVNTILDSNQLSQATQSLAGAFSTTRQTAFTRNYPASLRLYRYADPTRPGEKAGDPSTGRYRAFQIFVNTGGGSLVAVQKVVILPANTVINNGAYSTLLKGKDRADISPGPSDASLPSVKRDYLYQDLIINPSGNAVLSAAADPWSLTVELARAKDADPLPSNFASLVLNPINGTIRIYRP